MLFSRGSCANKLDQAQTVLCMCAGERRFDTFWTDFSVKPFMTGFPIWVSATESLLISDAFIHVGFNVLKMFRRSAPHG